MKVFRLLAVCAAISIVALLSACSTFSTTQTDASYDKEGKPQRTITTKATARTFWDSKSALAKFKASQTDKTQSATVGSLSQESAATNVVETIEALARLAAALKLP